VPVTVTTKLPLTVELQESVELPVPPVTLVGVRVQVNPPVTTGDTLAVRATVPVNPFTGAIAMLEVPAWLTLTATLVGVAVIVKSVTVKVTVAEWDSVLLVPVTVTVYVPAGPEQDSVDVWEAPRTMLVGVRVHVNPAGETVEASATVPVKPLSGATVIVDVAVAPARAATLVGLAVTV
jgi:hypothetical protein